MKTLKAASKKVSSFLKCLYDEIPIILCFHIFVNYHCCTFTCPSRFAIWGRDILLFWLHSGTFDVRIKMMRSRGVSGSDVINSRRQHTWLIFYAQTPLQLGFFSFFWIRKRILRNMPSGGCVVQGCSKFANHREGISLHSGDICQDSPGELQQPENNSSFCSVVVITSA